eukprot:1947777-Rhodomonas_salina.1
MTKAVPDIPYRHHLGDTTHPTQAVPDISSVNITQAVPDIPYRHDLGSTGHPISMPQAVPDFL